MVTRAEDNSDFSARDDVRRVAACEAGVNAVTSRYVAASLGAYNIPDFIASDRYFTFRSQTDAEYLAMVHQWAFFRAGQDEYIREIAR